MIDVKLIKGKLNAEEAVKEAKLWLAQKEYMEYANWKAKEENQKDRTAMDKVLASLKLEDETWMQKEEELITLESTLKTLNLVVDTLKLTMSAMSRHEDVTLDYFNEIQGTYINELVGEI